MNTEELKSILDQHLLWIQDATTGAKANLREADLSGAYLRRADLSGANLREADLREAYLRGAKLSGAKLPPFQIPQDGSLTVWKKGIEIDDSTPTLIQLLIPAEAKRTACLISRKCRAEFAQVVAFEPPTTGTVVGLKQADFIYVLGETIRPDSYDDDIRVECSHGIHFFLTKAEAQEFTM